VGIDVDRQHLCRLCGREDGVDPASRAHVEHPVALVHLGKDRLTEEV
jgi:hypothetical protein